MCGACNEQHAELCLKEEVTNTEVMQDHTLPDCLLKITAQSKYRAVAPRALIYSVWNSVALIRHKGITASYYDTQFEDIQRPEKPTPID
jgi:hypothetical protein